MMAFLELDARNADNPRELVWVEHVVSDVRWKQRHRFLEPGQVDPKAIARLTKLAEHRTWWVRLYVAQILREEPDFRTAAAIAQLEKDPHPIVRQTICEIKQTGNQ